VITTTMPYLRDLPYF